MYVLIQSSLAGARTARALTDRLETAIREGRLSPGAQLPPVRGLAAHLALSPATVAAAYATLRLRGFVTGAGRRGTRVSPRPPVAPRSQPPLPPHLTNLAEGNPDPSLLPAISPVRPSRPRLYGESPNDERLLDVARGLFEADGIPAEALAIVGGAMDGIERVLQAHLRPGDRVVVEDPGYPAVLDLLGALGLAPVPVDIDDFGPLPDRLSEALSRDIAAVILTPRAQNPTGAALDKNRARALRQILDRRGDVLVIEDDHAGVVAGAPAHTLCHPKKPRWAVIRSVSKSLGPDLRLALLAADPTTASRVQGRQALGAGWVSHILQATVAELLLSPSVSRQVQTAAKRYAERRVALITALARHGLPARGRSGLNVWVPVAEEAALLAALAEAGWAVRAGDRYRLLSPPALRVTVASLLPQDAGRLARDMASCLRPRPAVPTA